MSYIITITGPSGCGKSTFIKYLINQQNADFLPCVITKYTTRKKRDEDDYKKVGNYKYIEAKCVKSLPKSCDFIYEQYSVRYGIRLGTLFDKLNKGFSPIVILNDVRAVEDLRNMLGKNVISIFIFKESPSLEKHILLGKQRGVDNKNIAEIRYRKAQNIYRIYIENIQLFDRVILNCGKEKDLLFLAKNIINNLFIEKNWPLKEI